MVAGDGAPEAARSASIVRDSVSRNNAALIFGAAGFVEEAVELLEPLLAGPGYWQPCEARFSPYLGPIRIDPRFKALLEKYPPDMEH